MAEENQSKIHETTETPQVETQDRGLFDFLGNKHEEKTQEEVIVSEFDKVKVSEPSVIKVDESKHEDGEKKHSLLDKLHRSDSSSSSSSDEEEGEGGEKKKKKGKKGLKEKIEEKISGEKEEVKHEEDTAVPVEKCEVQQPAHHDAAAATNPEEKKGFLEKIKEKLPGQHKKPEEVPASSEHAATEAVAHESEAKEKKGILEKIKEKLPGYHSKTEEEKEEEEKKDDVTH